jgi:hypothetical protein
VKPTVIPQETQQPMYGLQTKEAVTFSKMLCC